MDYSLTLMGQSYCLSAPADLGICTELKPFLSGTDRSKSQFSGEIIFSFVRTVEGPSDESILFPSESITEVRERSENKCIIYNRKNKGNGFLTKSILEKGKITVICDSSYRKNMMNTDVLLKKIYLESFFLMNRSFILHSSLIQFEGVTVAFCAPKQTGKSTQAALWEKEKGAKILNGDRAGIRLADTDDQDSEVMAYGLPHAGSSSIYINEGAPLKTVILLEQAPVNTLERMEGNVAFARMFSQVNVPRTDELLLSLAISHLEEMICSVPVYLLKCTPDVRAVEILYNELFGKEEQSSHD